MTTHIVDLTQDTIEANSRFFDSMEEVPKQAISMGIHSILNAIKNACFNGLWQG